MQDIIREEHHLNCLRETHMLRFTWEHHQKLPWRGTFVGDMIYHYNFLSVAHHYNCLREIHNFVVISHWNCLSEAVLMCYHNIAHEEGQISIPIPESGLVWNSVFPMLFWSFFSVPWEIMFALGIVRCEALRSCIKRLINLIWCRSVLFLHL